MAYVNLGRGLGAARGRGHVLPGMSLYPRRSWRRGIAGFGTRSRGLGISFPQVMIPVPQPGGLTTEEPSAETSLANAAAQYINDPTQFTAAYNTPEYASPAAFMANMISFAQSLCNYSYSPYTCAGFDPVTMGQKYANIVFNALRGIVLSSTGKTLYDTWVSKPPALPGDYTPPVIPAPYNPASVPGSSALPPPPVSQPVAQPVSPVSTLPVPMPPVAAPPVSGAPGAASTGSQSSSSQSSNAGPAAPALNWPLIGGAALLLFGGLYVLGGD